MLVPIVVLCLATYVNGKLCENNQFWSSILESCENCSRCVHPDIVIRPCQGYTDTVCGPLSELNIDWTWLRNQGGHSSEKANNRNIQNEMLETFKKNFKEIRQHEKHMREKQKYLKRKQNRNSEESSEEIDEDDAFVEDHFKFKKNESKKQIWEKLKLLSKHNTLQDRISDDLTPLKEKTSNHLKQSLQELKTWQELLRSRADPRGIDHLYFNDKEAFELLKSSRRKDKRENDTYDPNHLKFDENGILVKNFGFTEIEDNVKMEKLVDNLKLENEFSTTEKFILDWQTVILGIAVSSCIIFFVVAAIYSMQHAKHWKKLRNHFDSVSDFAHLEELQSWISSKNSKNKMPQTGIYKTTTEVVHTGGTQCKYLERIIRMNGKNKFNFVSGNVYEKENKRPSELKPLTKKYPLVHKNIENRISQENTKFSYS